MYEVIRTMLGGEQQAKTFKARAAAMSVYNKCMYLPDCVHAEVWVLGETKQECLGFFDIHQGNYALRMS